MIEKRGKKFRVKFYLDNTRRLSKTFLTRAEAQEWERIMEAKKLLNQIDIDQPGRNEDMIYNDLVKEWYQTDVLKLSKSSQVQYKATIKNFFFPSLREKSVKSITPHDCDLIFKELSRSNLSARSINKALILMKQIFNFAVRRDLIDKNPARNLKNLKVQSVKDDYLSDAEIKLLLSKARNEWFFGAILLSLNTGMRLGEVAGLKWDMIDFDNRIITVSRNLTKEGLNEFTKTHVKKVIPMNDPVYEFLISHKRSKLLQGYVIINPQGKPIRPDHFTSRNLKKITKGTTLHKYGFHCLRHTFASHWMMNGGNIFDLQKILGHTKIEMTMRYAHLSPDHLHEKIKIVNFK